MFSKRFLVVLVVSALTLLVLGGVFYTQILPGLSVARAEPPALEVNIAQWLLRASVPEEARTR